MLLDQQVFNIIHGLANANGILDIVGVFFAQYAAYVLAIVAIFLIFKEKKWKKKIYFFSLASLSVILSRGIITEVIRFFYHSPRPFVALGFKPLLYDYAYSFPSGHMAAYVALSLAIFYLNKKAGYWFFGTTFLIGMARIFVGVHWPSDILGGVIIAILSFYLIKYLLFYSEKKEAPPQTE
ncbi:MAG: phosphatase PAP2 family protein [Patescibacteria group bacterium]